MFKIEGSSQRVVCFDSVIFIILSVGCLFSSVRSVQAKVIKLPTEKCNGNERTD
jgi:hypothetical protein